MNTSDEDPPFPSVEQPKKRIWPIMVAIIVFAIVGLCGLSREATGLSLFGG
jgi:hypothetical protein